MKKKILISESQLEFIIKNIHLINENEFNPNSNAPVWGKKRRGELKFDEPMGDFAYFKNNGLFDDLDDDQIIIISSNSLAFNSVITNNSNVSVANINIKLDLEDPFNFDRTTLTPNGESNYKKFIDEYKINKNKNNIIWSKYLSFIKEKGGLEILGYASQDADPNAKDGGKLEACSKYGVGKGLRSQYNQCLSQERANYIKDRLIKDLPELDGLLIARGMGETCEFGPCWTNNKKVTPKDTFKNRRFIINFPDFKEQKSNVDKKNINTNTTINWGEVNSYVDLSEFGISVKYKAIQTNSGIKLEPGKTKELRNLMDNKIPIISAAQFNGENIGDAMISINGFKIKSGDGQTIFNGWKSPDKIYRTSKLQDKKVYKQTDWVLSILQSQDVVLRKYAIILYLL